MPRTSARAKKPPEEILILGIGNVLLKDEGLGVKAVELLGKTYALPENVKCLDGGTAGLNLLSVIQEFTRVIIIDAVRFGGRAGDVHLFSANKLPEPKPVKGFAHAVGVGELLALAKLTGRLPRATVAGMEPKDISPGLELTPEVQEKLPELVKAVRARLTRLGVKMKRRANRA